MFRFPFNAPGRAFCQTSSSSANSAEATLNASGAIWTLCKPSGLVKKTTGIGRNVRNKAKETTTSEVSYRQVKTALTVIA